MTTIKETINETIEELSKCDNNIPFFTFDKETHLSRIVKCYDGDTFHCIFKHNGKYQKFHIRLYQYDSAEMKPSKQDPIRDQQIEKANEAKKKLEEYILNKNVYLYLRGFDKYGRILAEIKLTENDQKTINQLMIDGVYGYEYYGGTKKEKIATNSNIKSVNNKPKRKQKIKIDTNVDLKI